MYNVSSQFGNELGPNTIGVKRETKASVSPGPGHYSPEKVTAIVKPREVTTDFSKTVGRPKSSLNPNNGPGTYKTIDLFATSLKTMKIGQRRD